MRVCIVAEGCYPYVVGGVSSWIHSLVRSFPNVEFVLLTIVANRSVRGKFVYELPENITEVHELYLDDFDWSEKRKKKKKLKLSGKEYQALRSLILNQNVHWQTLFELFQRKELSLDELLMGEDFSGRRRTAMSCSLARSYFRIFCGRCAPFICRCFLH